MERQRTFLQAVLRHLPIGIEVVDAATDRLILSTEEVRRILRIPEGASGRTARQSRNQRR